MRYFIPIVLVALGLVLSIQTKAQVGIGTTTPDSSAVLELYSTSRGFLMSRLTTAERDLINMPATGLMIYNLMINEVQVNTGTPLQPVWTGMNAGSDPTISSVNAFSDLATSSTTSELIPGMILNPGAGTYMVMFNGQYRYTPAEPISTAQGVIDLQSAYTELMAFEPTNTTHAAIFGNGETLTSGVYSTPAASSLAGILTLDGGGDTNSVFIFQIGGALSTGAETTVVLINGATSNNIFWIAEGALSLAANTIMKGTLISHDGAVSAAAGTDLEGRMFSTTGAISFGPGTAAIPSGDAYVDLGVLSSFVMFTSSGAVTNTDPSTITGDVGTNLGAVAGFENLNGNIYTPGSSPPANNPEATFGVYQNNILIVNSARTTSDINTGIMTLHAIATIVAGDAINIRWRVDEGEVIIGNRVLTVLSVGQN